MENTHKPNFFLLGAAKSGTTSLYYYLAQHPQVCISEPKEPRFFEKEYAQGMEFYWQTYFKNWRDEPFIGDACPRNLFLPYVPARIKAQCPEAKLLVLLRNPVDRAFSAWWMRYSLGVEKLPFEQAIQANLEQQRSGFTLAGADGEELWCKAMHWGGAYPYVKYRWYLEEGYYAQQLLHYLALFSREQLKVVFLAELKDALGLTNRVLSFLGATPLAAVDATPQMVGTPKAGLPLLRIMQKTRIQSLIPQGIRDGGARLLTRYSKKPDMSPAMRLWLMEHYRPYNQQLELLLGKDLSHWNG